MREQHLAATVEHVAQSRIAGLQQRGVAGRERRQPRVVREARLAREQSEVDLQNSEQTIRVEVRIAVRAVDSGLKRFEAAAVNVELQGKKLDAEQKKFENGMSTTFEVRQFQNDLSEAQLSQIRAGLDYAKALAALERVKGTLLESHNLSVSP